MINSSPTRSPLEKFKQIDKNTKKIQVIQQLTDFWSKQFIFKSDWHDRKAKQMLGGRYLTNNRLVVAQYFWLHDRWNLKHTWVFQDDELLTGSELRHFNHLYKLLTRRATEYFVE